MNLSQRLLQSRSAFFWLNLALVGLLVLLIEPSYHDRSLVPYVFGRSDVRYALYLAGATVALALYAAFCCKGGEALNRSLFASAVVGFILAESAARFAESRRPYTIDIYRSPQPYVMFTGRPNVSGVMADNYRQMGGTAEDAEIRLNQLGLRGSMPSKGDHAEYRVITLGGSAVFNGVPLSASIPGQLESLDHQAGRSDAKVYNWGVVASVSGQELSLLVHQVIEYAPDLVIVYDGANDITEPYWYDPRPGYPYNFMVYESGLAHITGRGSSLRQDLLSFSFARSHFMRLLFGAELDETFNLRSLRKTADYGSAAWENRIVGSYLANVDKMCVVGHAYGFGVAVFLQPVLPLKDPKVGGEARHLPDIGYANNVARSYGRARAGLKQLQTKRGDTCMVVDLSSVFGNSPEELYWDFIHVNNRGNQLIAAEVFKHVSQFRSMGGR